MTIIRPRKIIYEIEDIGFEAELQPDDGKIDIREIVRSEMIKYKIKFLVALAIYLPILILIWIIPYTPAAQTVMTKGHIWRGNTAYILVILILSSIIQFGLGRHFFTSAYKSVKHGSPNMDVLVTISTMAAWLYGVALIFVGYSEKDQKSDMYRHMIHNHAHNWETNSVLIFIILIGKFIESFSKMKTVDKLSNLASLKVTKANLVKEEDQNKVNLSSKYDEIAVELLEIGDFVFVQPGGAVPTDGTVIFGRGCCNEAMLTGESAPVVKDIGVQVFGGTILVQGSIILKVTKTSEDATFNQIMKLVENAQNSKAPIQGYADKISAVFVPTIVGLAILAWIIWFSIVYTDTTDKFGFVKDPSKSKFTFAFNFGISTLVIACPCALGLATPTAVMVGTGLAASFGILIKSADILEKIKQIDTIVFDKTGTLTSGNPKVKDLINCNQFFKLNNPPGDNNFLYKIVYLAEKTSEHPIAQAICAEMQKQLGAKNMDSLEDFTVNNFKNRNGEGILASI